MKTAHITLILKFLSIIVLLLLPIPFKHGYLSFFLFLVVITFDGILELNFLYIELYIGLLIFTGMVLPFFKKNKWLYIGYLLTYVGLISMSTIDDYEDWAFVSGLLSYLFVSCLVMYLTFKRNKLNKANGEF